MAQHSRACHSRVPPRQGSAAWRIVRHSQGLAMLALAGLGADAAAQAQAPLCPGIAQPANMPDGRLLNHYPYAETPAAQLAAVPAGFSSGSCAKVHKDALPDLVAMIAAAKADGITLRGISCFRGIAYQRTVFCRADKLRAQGGVAGRAKSSAPPGYSEHATGYAIDFGRGNADLTAAFADRPMGQWLAAHAPRFGFELSFPKGNAQGVTFEPWHWRWVGSDAQVATGDEAALKARAIFAAARRP